MYTALNTLKALTLAGILGMILSFSSKAQAQDVCVELISGESYTATLSEQTDTDNLWLSFEGAGVTLLRPVAWGTIESVEIIDATDAETLTFAGDVTFAELAQAALAVEAPAVEGDIEAAFSPTKAALLQHLSDSVSVGVSLRTQTMFALTTEPNHTQP